MAAKDDFKVTAKGLRFLIEERQDSLGKVSYLITTSQGKFRLRSWSAVTEFIELNRDLCLIS